MTITATCCVAYNFPSDDAIAIDYTNICNSAPRSVTTLSLATLVVLVGASLFLL